MKTELEKWGISLATNLADNVSATLSIPIIEKDYATLKNYLYGIMNYKEIIYSAILAEDGSILAIDDPKSMLTSKILDMPSKITEEEISTYQMPDGTFYYNLIEPIDIEKRHDSNARSDHFDPLERAVSEITPQNYRLPAARIGTVILGISLENLNQRIERMRNKAIYIAIISSLFTITFVFWAVARITRPIKELDIATRKVAKGDLSHRVVSDRVDELGRLAYSFNEMISRLKESQEKVAYYTHILERKVDERTRDLQISEQKYRTLFEHAGTAVALIDESDKLIMVNKVFELLSKCHEELLIGKKMLSDFLSADDCGTIKALCGEVQFNNAVHFPINHECLFIDYKNNLKKINLTVSRIPGTSNLLISMVDVTELRDLQKKFARSEHLAALGELSASIAHEIRNPLVAIHTSVGILKSGLNLVGEDAELMNIIDEESMRLSKIVDDFLKFARPNEPQLMETNVNYLIHETLLLLKTRLNGIETRFQMSDRSLIILADSDQIKQVLMNIMINAIEAMPSGGVLNVVTKYSKNRNGHSSLEIKIKDTGDGIQQYQLNKIFQPFYSTKKNGVGMGLAVCDRIIQNHDGEIIVNSDCGKGTEFSILLPIKTNFS